MNKINIHMYPSNFTSESRILRETDSIGKRGLFDDILILAIWEPGLQQHQRLDERRLVWRIALTSSVLPAWTPFKMMRQGEWMLRILVALRNRPVAMTNCHCLSSLLAGVVLKRMTRSILVYDTHELETERNGWSWARRLIGKTFEKALIGRVDLVITVNESIAEWYRSEYSINNVHAVYNFPQVTNVGGPNDAIDLKKKFHIRDDEVLFIYLGILGPGRGVELMLDVFSHMSADKHLVLMGFGVLEDKVLEFSQRYSNIHFHPAVNPDEVVTFARSADVGLYLIENTSLSYYLSLGNKFAECIAAGLPVVTVDLPEPARMVDTYDCGWKVERDANAISDLIRRVSIGEVMRKKENVLGCREAFTWTKEELKLIRAYQSILPYPRTPGTRQS